MDVQLKRGLLDVCVLAAIKNEDSYGYKIIKDLSPYIKLSESTLYTILKRLEASEMLTVKTVEYDGRLRKYYHITKAGLGRIEANPVRSAGILPPQADRDFLRPQCTLPYNS